MFEMNKTLYFILYLFNSNFCLKGGVFFPKIQPIKVNMKTKNDETDLGFVGVGQFRIFSIFAGSIKTEFFVMMWPSSLIFLLKNLHFLRFNFKFCFSGLIK